jgi:cytoskeleton protein RodZ
VAEAEVEKEAGLAVGEYLKKVRESKGLELDEASRVTKIGKNYLLALEAGEFDRLPSPAYIKGFLRLYAGFLDLPGDDVVRRYEGSLPSTRPQVEAPATRPGMEIMERTKRGGPSRWVIPAVLLALVLVAAFFFSEKEERPVSQAQQQAVPPAPSTPAPEPPKVAGVQPQRSSAATASPAATSATTPATSPLQAEALPPVTPPAPGGAVLRLRFNRDSWLSITIDDAISQRYDLKAGDVIEWKGSKGFVVDVGDGGAVEGDINGRGMKALGEAGKPAHVELKGP